MKKGEMNIIDKEIEDIDEKDLIDYLESLDSNIKNLIDSIEKLSRKTEMMQESLDLAIKMIGAVLKKMKTMILAVKGKELTILENDKGSEIIYKINHIVDTLNYIKNQYQADTKLKNKISNTSLLSKILKNLRIKNKN
jgi:CHASE3 domain sensor protein